MYVLVAIVSLIASLLTFFSGFGLGTILLPVFALFFDIPTSIGLTALVHFSNSVFKFILAGKKADKHLLLVFGIPSFIASFAGALLLEALIRTEPLFTYEIGGHLFQVTLLGLIVGIVMAFFALWEVIPILRDIHFDRNKMIIGGALSGFFGGLSGHQGALRSAFLIRLNQDKETFIATGIVIACLVDLARMIIYAGNLPPDIISRNSALLACAVLAAWSGAFIGNKLLKKTTFGLIKWLVLIFMIIIAILMATGILTK